ncbi:ac112 [Sucra jujuba nucleopolyhedrovirus]|uniref:Ac112 n=1 Tax=Sucra jujuba nucleopolyhedrovirus TaxID=1563660 RepID=A0A097P924_9ABAC|nr:ac112 [Sucra jujuba nucleopolyhedrovirus]AIU41332.1 ac112 [Sucra jujuba nucleopolyhedrovirus]
MAPLPDDKLCIVFVWYHEKSFVYNTYEFPFWHNIQFHSIAHECYVLYAIDDTTAVQWPNTNPTNVRLINFKKGQHEENLDKLKRKSCKIDYIKLALLLDETLIECEKRFLVMDMDCTVQQIDWIKYHNQPVKYYVRPFFDYTIKHLYQRVSESSYDSYIENYAMLVDRRTHFLKSYQKFTLDFNDAHDNSHMYNQYLLLIQLYYSIHHKYVFPSELTKGETCWDDATIRINFQRGASWNRLLNTPDAFQYRYHYIYKEPPLLGRTCLLTQIFVETINKNVNGVNQLANKLFKLNYNFQNKYRWSNSQQSFTNLAGFIIDHIKNFNFDDKPYMLPIVTFQ